MKETLIDAYKIMCESRLLDEKMLILLKQGKSYFHIGCMGHEAIQVAMGLNMIKGVDYLFPYYRDQAFCMSLGQTSLECLWAFLGKKDDPHAGARQMPMHYGNLKLNIPSSSSSTGTQFLQATGSALASKRLFEKKKVDKLSITICSAGDGTTSQGEFYEAISWAAKDKAPIIFLIQNNHYAISVPINEQRPGSLIAENFSSFYGLTTYKVDGCNFKKSFNIAKKIIDDVRKGLGPVLLEADVIRLLAHSSSDDQKKYRGESELLKDKKRDPKLLLRQQILQDGYLNEQELENIEKNLKEKIDDAAEEALKADPPDKNSSTHFVFSLKKEEPEPELIINKDDEPIVMVDAINRALAEGLAYDEKMLVFGQDVAHSKGGVFTATRNLTKRFGADRCFNTPLAEASIVGVAIGLALRGFRPVAEIQFADYIWTAMMQIRNELSTLRYRSNNNFFAPVVIRAPVGGYIHGGLCHSQNIESTFAHFPGIKIALPSTAIDAYGLLKASFRQEDPVLFLEHKALYRQGFAKSHLPSNEDYFLPFGKGQIRLEGKDITIITYGILVQRALEAAQILKEEGLLIEVVDLRTIVPMDRELIFQSARKTGKVLVLHEDTRFMGFGAEIASDIQEFCFTYLDAPVMRLAGKDAPIPYSQELEEEVLPQSKDIYKAIKSLAAF